MRASRSSSVTPPRRYHPARRRTGQGGKCSSGKIRYRDHEEAVAALNSIASSRNLGNARRNEDRAYECARCGGFHITSTPYEPDPRKR